MNKNALPKILEVEDIPGGWRFQVAVNGLTYRISLEKSHWLKLAGEGVEPRQLVAASMRFLLDREPAEQILRQFDLNQINDYFSDYEDVIKGYL